MPRIHRRPALTVAVGAALLALAAGCGGEPAAEQSNPTPPASGGLAAYAACLREQGIDVPDDLPSARPGRSGQGDRTARPSDRPTARPSGQPAEGNRQGGLEALRPADVDDATWASAQQACEGSRPQGGRRGDG
ncbi:hypothetical protein O7600_07775 [Micromonospora sp. WMMA1998]|nr:hypothetical protein [Micromonospora sp. WMMA1998]WBC16729.1 hypothetical protein O7600_07775 [Micromonospora sp. WMMA1998]